MRLNRSVGRKLYRLAMSSNRMNDVPVEVCVDGRWFLGWLDPDNWDRNNGRHRAMVRCQSAPAETAFAGLTTRTYAE